MDRPGPATRTSEISFEVFASINVPGFGELAESRSSRSISYG